jgi:tetratricopeptide (TPR) repeat protein
MFPGGRMNKRILLVLAVLLSLFACSTNAANKAEKVEKSELATKVAILPLKSLDSSSRYINKLLTVRDLELTFDKQANYILMDMDQVAHDFKTTGYKDVEDLQVEEIKEISETVKSDVIIMGNISESRRDVYNVSMRFYSTRSEELKQISFPVVKEKHARWKSLDDNFMSELNGFISNEMDKIFNIGANYYNNQNYVEAEKSLKQVIALKPDKVDAYYILGNTYSKTGKYDLAEQNYKKMMELAPEDQRSTIALIGIYETTNQNAKRIALMERIADANEDEEMWLAIGNLYDQEANPEKAKSSFRRALEINPEYSTANVRLALKLYDEERYAESIPYLEKAFDQAPDNDLISRRLAVAYQRSNRMEDAIARYEGLIQSNPTSPQAYLNVVGLYRTLASDAKDTAVANQYNKKAIDTINALKAIDPNNAYVYLNLAAIYLSQGKYNEAETNANQTISRNASLYQPYVILSAVYQTRGTEQYNRYIDLDRQAAKAVGSKARKLAKDRDAAKANANGLFRRAQSQLEQARSKTSETEALNDISNRLNRIAQLISQTV